MAWIEDRDWDDLTSLKIVEWIANATVVDLLVSRFFMIYKSLKHRVLTSGMTAGTLNHEFIQMNTVSRSMYT